MFDWRHNSSSRSVAARDNTNWRSGGPGGWKAVFPNEKHKFFAGWRASGLYTERASGSTLSWSVEKDWPECCLFTLCAAR